MGRGQDPSDEVLAAAAQAGEEASLRALFDRHAPPLQALLLRRIPPALRRKVSVADVLQEAYAAAWAGLGSFCDRGPGSFRAWLARIADHKARNVIRDLLRERRDVRREVHLAASGLFEVPGRRRESPSAYAVARELDGRLKAAMGQLAPAQRTILSLVLVEGLSMEEAGRRMKRSANAAQKLFQRAKDRLWTDCYGDPGDRA
jgi:RNA polymerase sigma-70 factor (ECF subfamily)